METNKDFISYEQALELKELGFDEPCLSYYEGECFSYHLATIENNGKDDYILSAPLFQQAFRWFKDKHKLYYTIDNWNAAVFRLKISFGNHTPMHSRTRDYNTYEEAELACLKELIEIVKNK